MTTPDARLADEAEAYFQREYFGDKSKDLRDRIVAALRASQPGTVSREAIAKVIDPKAFDPDHEMRHRHCSPFNVDVVQNLALVKADAILSLSIPANGREALEAVTRELRWCANQLMQHGYTFAHGPVPKALLDAEAALSALPVKSDRSIPRSMTQEMVDAFREHFRRGQSIECSFAAAWDAAPTVAVSAEQCTRSKITGIEAAEIVADYIKMRAPEVDEKDAANIIHILHEAGVTFRDPSADDGKIRSIITLTKQATKPSQSPASQGDGAPDDKFISVQKQRLTEKIIAVLLERYPSQLGMGDLSISESEASSVAAEVLSGLELQQARHPP